MSAYVRHGNSFVEKNWERLYLPGLKDDILDGRVLMIRVSNVDSRSGGEDAEKRCGRYAYTKGRTNVARTMNS
jgi:hypothetical protein